MSPKATGTEYASSSFPTGRSGSHEFVHATLHVGRHKGCRIPRPLSAGCRAPCPTNRPRTWAHARCCWCSPSRSLSSQSSPAFWRLSAERLPQRCPLHCCDGGNHLPMMGTTARPASCRFRGLRVKSRAASVRAGPSLPSRHARPYLPAMDVKYWTKALREAEAELEAARTRTAVNAAAKKLQRAKAELRALEATRRRGRSERLPVGLRPGALPHDLIGFRRSRIRIAPGAAGGCQGIGQHGRWVAQAPVGDAIGHEERALPFDRHQDIGQAPPAWFGRLGGDPMIVKASIRAEAAKGLTQALRAPAAPAAPAPAPRLDHGPPVGIVPRGGGRGLGARNIDPAAAGGHGEGASRRLEPEPSATRDAATSDACP